MSFEVTVRDDRFMAALRRSIVDSKRNARDVINTQLKGFVRNVYGVTFPMRGDFAMGTPDFNAGKERGQQAMLRGLRRAFKVRETDSKKAKTKDLQTLLAWYLSKRNKRKQYRGPKGQHDVSKADFEALSKMLYKRQGSVAAGWNAMGEKYGFRPPAWINKWGTSAGYIIDLNELGFLAVNETDHPDSKLLQRQIQIALDAQAGKMERASAKFAERNFGK